jgi:uncharacterized protein (TIGR03437 family)
VQVLFNGSSAIWSVPVAPAAPGIFTLDATGTGQAAVLNQDNSVNGPAQTAAGASAIQIFATGIPVAGAMTGSITPAPAPGSTYPVNVAISGGQRRNSRNFRTAGSMTRPTPACGAWAI